MQLLDIMNKAEKDRRDRLHKKYWDIFSAIIKESPYSFGIQVLDLWEALTADVNKRTYYDILNERVILCKRGEHLSGKVFYNQKRGS